MAWGFTTEAASQKRLDGILELPTLAPGHHPGPAPIRVMFPVETAAHAGTPPFCRGFGARSSPCAPAAVSPQGW
jgi:hypothetical protein